MLFLALPHFFWSICVWRQTARAALLHADRSPKHLLYRQNHLTAVEKQSGAEMKQPVQADDV